MAAVKKSLTEKVATFIGLWKSPKIANGIGDWLFSYEKNKFTVTRTLSDKVYKSTQIGFVGDVMLVVWPLKKGPHILGFELKDNCLTITRYLHAGEKGLPTSIPTTATMEGTTVMEKIS